MNIIVYTKTGCPWCNDALAFLRSNNIPFENREVLSSPAFFEELKEKSKQTKTPTFDIDGDIMPDSDVDQLREYLVSKKVIE